ncbi:Outer membrane protein/outer membrane enzyme PagP, beta-barrel,Surface antigen msp4, partial [Cinara cedri]
MSILSKKSLLKTAIVMLLLICVSSASFAFEKGASNSENEHKNEKKQQCYVGLTVGQKFHPLHDLVNKLLSASAGCKLEDFSIEIENMAPTSVDEGIPNLVLMTNGYYHFNNSSLFTPYIGFGVGLGQLSRFINSDTKDDFIKAYQGKFGLSYRSTSSTEISFGYKFLGLLKNTPKVKQRQDYDRYHSHSHIVEIGF